MSKSALVFLLLFAFIGGLFVMNVHHESVSHRQISNFDTQMLKNDIEQAKRIEELSKKIDELAKKYDSDRM